MGKFIELMARAIYGKEVALVLQVVNLILKALKDKDASDVAEFVYDKLPKRTKETCEKQEFMNAVDRGEEFVLALIACFKK